MEDSLLKVLTALDPDPEALADEGISVEDRHMNYAQLAALTVGAQNCTAVIGRGGGKSDGILAPRVHMNITEMPRSSGVALGTTYIQLLDRTLPALFNGFHRLGYQRDVDYWVRRFPDKGHGLKMPYNCPLTPEHSLFFRTDDKLSVMRLVSQDRPGTANGLSVDWLLGDEVKFLNSQKLNQEVRPINRGGADRFGHCSGHHGEWFTTDMPTTPDASWIFEAEEHANEKFNVRNIELILAVQLEIYHEKQKLATSPRNASRIARIRKLEGYLNQLRKGVTHYIEASAFVNVHVLGLSYYKDMYKNLRPAEFASSILGKRNMGVENGFYPDLDSTHHMYDAVDYAWIDGQDWEKQKRRDCRKDADIDHDKPLVISPDYGASFNCLWVAQRNSRLSLKNMTGYDEVRYLNHFYAPSPAKIRDVVQKFCEYYEYFYKKEVVFVYDHTAVGKDGKDELTYADLVYKELKRHGWRVKMEYIGQTKGHHIRYNAWGVALSERDERIARQRWNRENTRVGFEAMTQTRTKQGKHGFEKDKSDERNKAIDQWKTTHLTDAIDNLFYYLTFLSTNQQDLLPPAFSR
ncbi:hypothetical protein F5984_20535 [Rudanella paleaurantiibacter]|uniref:Uncharacterized protein n=1 Tax=Rudanella paleaurantiibacter TaxID=2614655 RepID=A0A7J5TVG3_9BACT|nr:hypothetical protein [Rudanella paleaurantiibacter]KAB7728135.1 hypothetical protein F5984_20535 [Rudanella paleaurantiibacter]